MSRRIAIVEDDAAIRANYADALRRQGYEVAAHADRARGAGGLPGAGCRTSPSSTSGSATEVDGGFALCRELRALSAELPIIFLTARDSDFDVVSGLRLGADDYLTKDVSLPHLLARIAALFRRSDVLRSPPKSEETVERGALRARSQAHDRRLARRSQWTSRSPSSGSCMRSRSIPATSRTASS